MLLTQDACHAILDVFNGKNVKRIFFILSGFQINKTKLTINTNLWDTVTKVQKKHSIFTT